MVTTIIVLSILFLALICWCLIMFLGMRRQMIQNRILEEEKRTYETNYREIRKRTEAVNRIASRVNSTVYVLGFCFDKARSGVILIDKQKPDWQKGKLNGIGGKVMQSESQYDAMARKFLNETGIITGSTQWQQFCLIHGENYIVYCMCTELDYREPIAMDKLLREEQALWYKLDKLMEESPRKLVTHLDWLIPMAQNPIIANSIVHIK